MKIRKQTYSLGQYLKLMQKETIRTDQECQRLSGQWNHNMVNELIATVLTDGYMPSYSVKPKFIDFTGFDDFYLPQKQSRE